MLACGDGGFRRCVFGAEGAKVQGATVHVSRRDSSVLGLEDVFDTKFIAGLAVCFGEAERRFAQQEFTGSLSR